MSNRIQLLDCTLREAPISGLQFGEEFICKFIKGLEDAHVDVIEVGFLKDEKYVKGSTIFNSVEQIEPYINKASNCKYVALIDYGRYNVDSLSVNAGKSIDAIRICFKKGEQYDAINLARKIKDKGYDVCIQHVDTLGYADEEIIDIIKAVNDLQPYAYSIVDTFGAMYQDDVEHIYSLVDEYLDKNIRLGFHAHNNLMLAGSNTQNLILALRDKRELIVDGSVYGCGRGAGNAHTELLIEFMNKKCKAEYDLNCILDLMDDSVPVLQKRAKWGYSIPYLISGMHGSHVYNVDYLLSRHNIKSKDLREIIDNLDDKERRMYDYPLLERLYVEHFSNPVDDVQARRELAEQIKDREVLLIAPGPSIQRYSATITSYIDEYQPYIIHVNNVIEKYTADSIFISSPKRYDEYREGLSDYESVWLTSNINGVNKEQFKLFDYSSLVKYGWINIDNSCMLLLRLLLQCGVSKITLAGVDGYNYVAEGNFYQEKFEKNLSDKTIDRINMETKEMLRDILNEYALKIEFIRFLTPSIYENVIGKESLCDVSSDFI